MKQVGNIFTVKGNESVRSNNSSHLVVPELTENKMKNKMCLKWDR